MSTDMQLGKIAEYQFILDASKRGFLISQPIHDHRGYDLVAQGKSNKLYKIQVKSTRTKAKNYEYYKVCLSRGSSQKLSYEKEHVDYFAIYILELNQWYIIPFSAIASKNVRIYPSKPNHKFSQYQQAWHLIK